MQMRAGRMSMHEHPTGASSWKLPEMDSLKKEVGVYYRNVHMCTMHSKRAIAREINLEAL